MINKEDFLKMVHGNDAVKTAVLQLKTQKEQNQIRACIDEVIGKLYDGIVSVYVPVQNNTDVIKKMAEEESSELISNTEPEKAIKDK